MKKIHIIMLAAAGLTSFALVFGVNSILKKHKVVPAAANAATVKLTPSNLKTTSIPTAAPQTTAEDSDSVLSESQLKTLIYDIRQKMLDYKDKQKNLDQQAQRIELAHQTLQEEIEQLNQLREKLNLTLTSLQEKERTIHDSLIEIETIEKANLQRIAATYDKMESAQAGKIMTTMTSNNQTQDAVKILYYMSDRSASKLLGEIGNTSPEIAGTLILQLKQIKEKK